MRILTDHQPSLTVGLPPGVLSQPQFDLTVTSLSNVLSGSISTRVGLCVERTSWRYVLLAGIRSVLIVPAFVVITTGIGS